MGLSYTNSKVSEGIVGEGVRKFQSHLKSAGVIDFDQLCAISATRLKDSKASVRATAETFGEVVKEKLAEGNRVTWDGLARFELAIEGAFDTIDAPFDPSKNKVVVNAIVYDNIKTAAEDVKPENEAKPADVRILGTQDETTMAQDELTIGNKLLIQGVGMFLDLEASDEGVDLVSEGGTVYHATVSNVTATTVDATFGNLTTPGVYKLVVKSRADHAGDLDYTLVEASRTITVVAA